MWNCTTVGPNNLIWNKNSIKGGMQSINKLDEKLKNMPKSAKTHPSVDNA
jgi:hypothetical protein